MCQGNISRVLFKLKAIIQGSMVISQGWGGGGGGGGGGFCRAGGYCPWGLLLPWVLFSRGAISHGGYRAGANVRGRLAYNHS